MAQNKRQPIRLGNAKALSPIREKGALFHIGPHPKNKKKPRPKNTDVKSTSCENPRISPAKKKASSQREMQRGKPA